MSTNSLFGRAYQGLGKVRPMSKLGENVRRLRTERGFSQAKLAKMIGAKSQNTIVAIEAGGRTTHVPALARALKVSIHDLDPDTSAQESFIIDDPGLIGAKDLPLYASVDAGEGALVVSSDPVDRIGRPAPLAHVRGGYGVIVAGESMSPLYRPGEVALVNPHLPPRVEDACIFRKEENGEFHATIKEYCGQTKDLWKVKRYQPTEIEFTLKKRDWPDCHVVIGKYTRR